MQCTPPTGVLIEGICVIIHEQLGDCNVSTLARQVECCPEQFVSGVNPGSFVQEELCHLRVALVGGYVQGRLLGVLLNRIEYL